jgi:CheY-like chemotaxis protein
MKRLILIVDDNEDILLNIRITLEQNNYDVITSSNGREALKILSDLDKSPDIIISDIMMPVLDGYDFFVEVSSTPIWSRIPFIFLTAKSLPEDIRFGKILGVDDYITKPFEEQDLLAIIKGKLKRKEKIESIDKRIEDLFKEYEYKKDFQYDDDSKCAVLLIMLWDDKIGPKLTNFISLREHLPYSLEDIGRQLFQASVSIYGYDKMEHAQGMLVTIENIKRKGYIYFDSYIDKKLRSGEQQFMIGFIKEEINYLESLKIREIFKNITKMIKNSIQIQLQADFQRILNIFPESN